MKHSLLRFGIASFTSLLLSSAALALSPVDFEEAPLTRIIVQHINGGINPSYRGLAISGQVLLAPHCCIADTQPARLESVTSGDQITIVAIRPLATEACDVCPTRQADEYVEVDTDVYYDRERIKRVVIKNATTMGHHQNAYEFLVHP